MSRLVRLNPQAAQTLESLCNTSGQSQQKVIEQALKRLLFEQTMKLANEQYAKLRDNTTTAHKLDEEAAAWDTTLQDGLKDD